MVHHDNLPKAKTPGQCPPSASSLDSEHELSRQHPNERWILQKNHGFELRI
jgi:hypothetical protein